MPASKSSGKGVTRSRTKAVPGPDQPADAGRAERDLQRDADIILTLLADGLPHTRGEIGEHAARHGISDARLGAIKTRMNIAHVRVQSGAENGLGRSAVAWVLKK